jgi:hypothetical protein
MTRHTGQSGAPDALTPSSMGWGSASGGAAYAPETLMRSPLLLRVDGLYKTHLL